VITRADPHHPLLPHQSRSAKPISNTDQQHLIPERSLSTLAQLGAIQVLMFVSAATGLAVGFAVICGSPCWP
jgi:K+-transporting ATPase A subunit